MEILLLTVVGILTGFINVFAGGGSLISLPLLIMLGLPVSVANGTNKVGLIFGGVSGAYNFYKKGEIDLKSDLLSVPLSLAGVFIGSKLSIDISEDLYTGILSVVMILVLAVILLKPQNYIKKVKNRDFTILKTVGFILIGFYAGFIQVGMGYLVITILSLTTRYSLIKITAVKVFICGFIFVTFSAALFIYYGKVNYPFALALGGGNALGAFIASNLAINNGERIFKPILIISVIVMSIKISGVYRLFI